MNNTTKKSALNIHENFDGQSIIVFHCFDRTFCTVAFIVSSNFRELPAFENLILLFPSTREYPLLHSYACLDLPGARSAERQQQNLTRGCRMKLVCWLHSEQNIKSIDNQFIERATLRNSRQMSRGMRHGRQIWKKLQNSE